MTSLLRRILPDEGAHRGRLVRLTAGHAGADLFLGAVPALIPFFVADRGLSYADAGLLVLAGSLASALVQPLAGLFGDRVRAPWLAPLGLVLAAAGLFAATRFDSFAAIALSLLLGGFGVAIFHPEAIRATRAASPSSPGTAMGVFSIGGSVGFALGPALAVPLAAGFGIHAAGAVAAVPLTTAFVLGRGVGASSREVATGYEPPPGSHGDWLAFAYATAAATSAAGVLFGLMAFVPVWFADELGSTVRLGSLAVSGMLLAGAAGTYAGGRLGDRYDRGLIVLAALVALVPLTAGLPMTAPAAAVVVLVLIGLTIEVIYYPLVIVAQDALPGRAGFASGAVLGLSVAFGAAATSVLGGLVDANGPVAALWACAGLAGVALLFGALARHPRRQAAATGTASRGRAEPGRAAI